MVMIWKYNIAFLYFLRSQVHIGTCLVLNNIQDKLMLRYKFKGWNLNINNYKSKVLDGNAFK